MDNEILNALRSMFKEDLKAELNPIKEEIKEINVKVDRIEKKLDRVHDQIAGSTEFRTETKECFESIKKHISKLTTVTI
ncbi:hypothetical protein [Inconstantimicrobium mannanitabidum]|uniref:Uncharacterized protein n=1 Tax=Inconstantimicrobium mannanitabidum TaxID=1604901 RepID=A0ACB5RDP7_9CLOT|nr:hypothetical protein [Clostridium sp. TW13]GKX66889.1 hypothetical protein rsdtw13_21470 [Clostridium sp. TW13]